MTVFSLLLFLLPIAPTSEEEEEERKGARMEFTTFVHRCPPRFPTVIREPPSGPFLGKGKGKEKKHAPFFLIVVNASSFFSLFHPKGGRTAEWQKKLKSYLEQQSSAAPRISREGFFMRHFSTLPKPPPPPPPPTSRGGEDSNAFGVGKCRPRRPKPQRQKPLGTKKTERVTYSVASTVPTRDGTERSPHSTLVQRMYQCPHWKKDR